MPQPHSHHFPLVLEAQLCSLLISYFICTLRMPRPHRSGKKATEDHARCKKVPLRCDTGTGLTLRRSVAVAGENTDTAAPLTTESLCESNVA